MDILKDVGWRNTGPRRRILEVLGAERALIASDVFVVCRTAGRVWGWPWPR